MKPKSIIMLMLCAVCVYAGADDKAPQPSDIRPLNFVSEPPQMISESSWSEGDHVVIEREFTVEDNGEILHLKRRYKEITADKIELIWRSPETVEADARFCSYTQRLPMKDGDVLVIRKQNGYSLMCHGKPSVQDSGRSSEDEAGVIAPQDVVVGDQYYRFANGDTTAPAGARQTAHATGYYRVRGVGQISIEFYSDAASCGATNYSNVDSPNALVENDIFSSLVCRVTDDPGYYAFHIEGCALGPPLCDAQDYVTTVIE